VHQLERFIMIVNHSLLIGLPKKRTEYFNFLLCIGAETEKILEFFKQKVIITNCCSEKLYKATQVMD
jgi:hypothetical protein